jgi:hypothetical protein
VEPLGWEFKKPKNEKIMLHIKCDVHNWMNIYVVAVLHPYFAVSTAKGTFEIDKVTQGAFMIEACQGSSPHAMITGCPKRLVWTSALPTAR